MNTETHATVASDRADACTTDPMYMRMEDLNAQIRDQVRILSVCKFAVGAAWILDSIDKYAKFNPQFKATLGVIDEDWQGPIEALHPKDLFEAMENAVHQLAKCSKGLDVLISEQSAELRTAKALEGLRAGS